MTDDADLDRIIADYLMAGELKPYSSDLSAAWSLVEKFGGRVALFGPGAPIEGLRHSDRWRAEILPTPETPLGEFLSAEAPTAARAITLAALWAYATEDAVRPGAVAGDSVEKVLLGNQRKEGGSE